MSSRPGLLLSALAVLAGQGEDLRIGFEESPPGRPPEGFLVLSGRFAVAEEDGGRHLRLPGAPLEEFGVLFGARTSEGVRVEASFRGRSRGRLHPSYGLGVHGLGGWRLMLSGSRGKLELHRGRKAAASADIRFLSGGWTRLALEAVPLGSGRWRLRGKAWDADGEEPRDWALEHAAQGPDAPGRASLWGLPFSGLPIGFDDLSISALPADRAGP